MKRANRRDARAAGLLPSPNDRRFRTTPPEDRQDAYQERGPTGTVGHDGTMRLTRASVYALHAVAYMAGQRKTHPIASHIIAEKRHISERFLLKVLKPLVSAQILTSVKGPNGGYRLAKPATEINLLEIIEAVDGPIRGHASVNEDDPHHPLNKRLEQICNQSAEAVRKQLGRIRISEITVKE